MQHEQWCRVTRNDPCPICGRGDWCLVAKDKSAAICPRTEAGSVSRNSLICHGATSLQNAKRITDTFLVIRLQPHHLKVGILTLGFSVTYANGRYRTRTCDLTGVIRAL